MSPSSEEPTSRSDFSAKVLTAALVALGFWLLTAHWPDTPDGWIHLHRVRALAEGLGAGVLYPRWFPDFGFGYGYPVLNFYAPGFYYPPALAQLGGLSTLDAVRLAVALLAGLAAWAMMTLSREWLQLSGALVAGLAYTFATYRQYDLFVRGALPEYAAFLWLPVLALALVRLDHAVRMGKQPGLPLLLAGGAWAGLILTHNLTALMAVTATLMVGLVVTGAELWPLRTAPWGDIARRWGWGAAALLLGLLLSAWYVVPALAEARWVGIGNSSSDGFQDHFAGWGTLLADRLPYAYPAASMPTVPVAWGLLLPATAALLLVAWQRPSSLSRPLLATLSVLLISLWLTTASSLWLWRLAGPAWANLQFPWRWQAVAAVASALAAGFLVALVAKTQEGERSRIVWAWSIALLLVILTFVDGFGALKWQPAPWAQAPDSLTRSEMLATDLQYGQVGASWAGEFLPKWVTEERWAIGREPPESPAMEDAAQIDLDVALLEASYLEQRYRVAAPEELQVTLQTFYYPAWQILVDGQALPTAASGRIGLLSAQIPSGEHQITVRWSATPAVTAGRLLAWLGWLIVLALLVRAPGRPWARRIGLASWLLVGLVGLAAAFGLLTRTTTVDPLHADFGSVALAGVVTPPARAGGIWSPALHWAVREDAPDLTAFVHVVDATGAIVAQNDGPLGGPFAPAARLTAGMILDVTTELRLPAELPSGELSLRVGLYPPGQPEAPIAPAGSATPYVLGGVIEVDR